MATPYDNDAVDFSVDTSELESGKLDDDGAVVFSPHSGLVEAGDDFGRAITAEEEGECGSDVEPANAQVNGTADKLPKVRSFPTSFASAKKQNVELEEGECDDDDENNKRTNLATHAAKLDAVADTTVRPAKQGVCVHFLKRTCTWGDNCRYFHPGNRTSIGNYVLFEELEQARQDNRPNASRQRQAGGPPNASSPEKITNSRRVPVHSRLGEPEMRSVGRAGNMLLGSNTVTTNAFVPMPFTLPKQETAWEAGLRKVSETQSSVQKRRERAEDMQLGISSAVEDVFPSHLEKSTLSLTTAIPMFNSDASKIVDSLSASVFSGSSNKIPSVLLRAPMFNDAASSNNLTDRQPAQFSPDRFAGRQNLPTPDELTITISNRDNTTAGARRTSLDSDLSDHRNDDMHMRGVGHPPVDHSRLAAPSRRTGHAPTNAGSVEFPPPPVHLLHSSSGPRNPDEQRRYDRQLSHYFPSRKYYMNLDSKPQEWTGSDNKGNPLVRSGGNNDSQLMSRTDDFEILRPFRSNESQRNLVADELPDSSDDRRSMIDRNNCSNNMVDNGNNYTDAAAVKEESALEVARRRHLERQRQHHPHTHELQQHQHHRQQRPRGTSRNSRMSNISSSSGEHSLDVVSDSEDKISHLYKRHHRMVVTTDETGRNNEASLDVVGKNNGTHVPAADAMVENSGDRKRTLSSVSTNNKLPGDSADIPTTLRPGHSQSNRSPTMNAESPVSLTATQSSPDRKKIMQQQRVSPPPPLITSKAKTMANNNSAARTKRQPVKLTINNNKRVKSSSGAVFDDNDGDADDDDDNYDGKQRQTVDIEDDSYESIGNSDDEMLDVAASSKTPGSETTSTKPQPSSKTVAISPHDREELLRQLRVIEEEIAAKRQRANAASTTTSAVTAK